VTTLVGLAANDSFVFESISSSNQKKLHQRRDCNNATTDIFCSIIDEDRVPPQFTQDIEIWEPYIPAKKQ